MTDLGAWEGRGGMTITCPDCGRKHLEIFPALAPGQWVKWRCRRCGGWQEVRG